MITVNEPYIYKTDNNKFRLEAVIDDDKHGTKKIWYEVNSEYSKYLCTELADAFLIAVIPIAVYTNQDIYVNWNVSPKLLFNTEHTHIPFYAQYFNKSIVKVSALKSVPVCFDSYAVVTGCSLGVDSISTILRHIDSNCPEEYKLTHLALFNSGQIGDVEQEKLEASFIESCDKSKKFADEVGIPFFGINTNLMDLIRDTDLFVTAYFHYFSTSCIMSIQKMIGKYLLSSSYNASKVCVDPCDVSHTESVVVPMLSNENVEVILSDPFVGRVDKVKNICANPLTIKYIDVCWANETSNIRGGRQYYLKDKTHRNCGWCEKCKRTLLTLELLGCIDDYNDAFDIDKYHYYRKDYIIKVFANAKYSIYYQEIVQLMKEKGMHIPLIAYIVRFFNVKDSKLVLWLWLRYNDFKRFLYKSK